MFGVEADIQASGADDTFAPYKFSNPWFGTLRGRAGFAINNVMLYGTAGLAYGELKGEFFGLGEDKLWLAGPLARASKYGFTQNWSAKLEYLYMDLGSRTYSITGADNGLHSSYPATRRELSLLTAQKIFRSKTSGQAPEVFVFGLMKFFSRA